MHLDHQAVGAGGQAGAADGADEVRAPGGMRRICDDGQMRRSFQVRDRADVEQVARHVVEAAHTPLTEDDLLVPAGTFPVKVTCRFAGSDTPELKVELRTVGESSPLRPQR